MAGKFTMEFDVSPIHIIYIRLRNPPPKACLKPPVGSINYPKIVVYHGLSTLSALSLVVYLPNCYGHGAVAAAAALAADPMAPGGRALA